jgi:hypothetical protein
VATETKIPDALLVQTNLNGAVTAIDEDPDAPGGDWLTAASNNVDSVCVVSFPTPTGNPTTGNGLQNFKWWARITANGTACAYNVYLRENGTRINGGAAIGTGSLTSTTGQLLTATWDAAALGTADGSLVEAEIVVTKSGGAPGARTSGEVGAVEWNVTYDSGTTHQAATSLVGSAVASLAGALVLAASMAISGAGTLAAAAGLVLPGAATLSASATLAASAGVTLPGESSLNASAVVAADGTVTSGGTIHQGEAALSAAATVSPAGIATYAGELSASATAAIAADGTVIAGAVQGEAALSATASIAPAAAETYAAEFAGLASAAIAADGTVTGAGEIHEGDAVLDTEVNIVAVGQLNDPITFYLGKHFTVATLPDFSACSAGSWVFVSDAPTGERFKANDGTAWKNVA